MQTVPYHPPGYFSDKTASRRYEVSRATWWRWVKEGNAPKPIKFNGSTRWRLEDLLEWEKEQGGLAQ